MCRRWLRVGAFGMAVVVAGCATAPPNPSAGAIAPESHAPTECTTSPSSGNGVARLSQAIGYGTVGVFLGALQGASDGAGWAWTTGGSGSHGAWIGAAAVSAGSVGAHRGRGGQHRDRGDEMSEEMAGLFFRA
jgi:hypothetical protein